jgi:hypothetical protein
MGGSELAIVNGFGLSLGDSLIGLQALCAAQTLGRMPPRPTLIRRTDCRPMVRALYPLAADFAAVADLPDGLSATPKPPLPASVTAGFERVIDMRDFAFDVDFRGVAMIDFFLRRLGLDPAAVPPDLRRNAWLAPRVTPAPVAGLPDRYVLFCPNASMAQRDIPLWAQEELLRLILGAQPLPVVTQGEVPPEMASRVIAAPPLERIALLCGLVTNAARIVSTDTAIPHLADAFGIPCHAVFATHLPEWRVRDYPLCSSTRLPVHGLPEALEFLRSEDDLRAVEAGWREGMAALSTDIGRFLAA